MAAPALTADAKRSLVEAIPRSARTTVRPSCSPAAAGCSAGQISAARRGARADPGTAFQTIADHYNPIVTALAAAPKPVLAASTAPARALACPWPWPVTWDLRPGEVLHGTTGIGLPDSGLSATPARAVGRRGRAS
jgi:2-(1,2-epoxy-1,2-dihydrophenyl)acetyl-CoA isomerase